jgi:hypothetical protein
MQLATWCFLCHHLQLPLFSFALKRFYFDCALNPPPPPPPPTANADHKAWWGYWHIDIILFIEFYTVWRWVRKLLVLENRCGCRHPDLSLPWGGGGGGGVTLIGALGCHILKCGSLGHQSFSTYMYKPSRDGHTQYCFVNNDSSSSSFRELS